MKFQDVAHSARNNESCEGEAMASKKASRRGFLKAGAAAAAVGAIKTTGAEAALPQAQPQKSLKELVAYGERSKFVSSVRVPVLERPSPEHVGLVFHVVTPLLDHLGIITPSSLHFMGTRRVALVPRTEPMYDNIICQVRLDRSL